MKHYLISFTADRQWNHTVLDSRLRASEYLTPSTAFMFAARVGCYNECARADIAHLGAVAAAGRQERVVVGEGLL